MCDTISPSPPPQITCQSLKTTSPCFPFSQPPHPASMCSLVSRCPLYEVFCYSIKLDETEVKSQNRFSVNCTFYRTEEIQKRKIFCMSKTSLINSWTYQLQSAIQISCYDLISWGAITYESAFLYIVQEWGDGNHVKQWCCKFWIHYGPSLFWDKVPK